jgi:hypothetical protein
MNGPTLGPCGREESRPRPRLWPGRGEEPRARRFCGQLGRGVLSTCAGEQNGPRQRECSARAGPQSRKRSRAASCSERTVALSARPFGPN